MPPAVHGILLIDKAASWTSHDVVAKARRTVSERKIGHTGTLDPMATGLLVLCLGDATRLVEYMTGHDKRYEGELLLGVRTDTDDAEGSPLETRPIPALTPEMLRQLEDVFRGELAQRPPAFSAIKVAGQRAYAAARAGNALELAERHVVVHDIRLLQLAPDRLQITVHCGAGTYIRSLARDIGESLGCGAHLAALRRTTAGAFTVRDAVTLDELAELVARGELAEVLRPPDEGVIAMDAALVRRERGLLFGHGNAFAVAESRPSEGGPLRVYDSTGTFLGIARIDANCQIQPLKVLQSSFQP